MRRRICIANGDGIGPEIMAAVLEVLETSGAPIEQSFVEMGQAAYEAGHAIGISPGARRAIEETGLLLKGPMSTPKAEGLKSINVTARKLWSAYANKRTFRTMPGVETVFSRAGRHIDLTLVRENIEDTDCVDQYRIRIESEGAGTDLLGEMLGLAAAVNPIARLCSVEMLLTIDGKPAYSLAQGQPS